MTAMELRISDDGGHLAVKTGPGVTAGEWFVYSPDNGGGYTDGVQQKVSEWRQVDLPEPLPEPEPVKP